MGIAGKVGRVDRSALVALLAVGLLLFSCRILDNPPRTLQMAAFKGDRKAVERFLGEGLSPDARGEEGMTALHFAVYGNRKSMVELLLRKGAEVGATDSQGRTPLHAAAWKGYVDIAEILLANGADAGAKDTKGLTPLHLAEQQNHEKMIALLRDRGTAKRTEQGQKPER